MKPLRRNAGFCIFYIALCAIWSARAAILPAGWQHEQSFDVSSAGLVKLSIPIETLDVARAGLEDLRVYDDAGNEVPYLIEHPTPAPQVVRRPKSFQTALNPQNTVITMETGFAQAIDRVILETGGRDFIKSVTIEGSSDGEHWQEIARRKPIFYQPDGVLQREVDMPPKVWAWLRLTIDDQRSAPIAFTGAYLRAASGESAPSEAVPVTVASRIESPGETHLTLDLPAANLNLSEIQIDSSDPLFTRMVDAYAPEIIEVPTREKTIVERLVGGGIIYRLAIEGQPASANLSLQMSQDSPIQSRELILRIHNNDSPPLTVAGVHVERRPVYLVFLAKQTGAYYLLSGNPHSAAPRYDLAAFGSKLRTVAVAPVKFSAVIQNPAFRPPEVLPEIQDNGAPLDVSAWQFRKAVKMTHGGPQQLELDLDLLSHSQFDLEDVRLIRDGKQVPYVIQQTSITRGLAPEVTVTNDFKNPQITRWTIKLPRTGVGFSLLDFSTRMPLFKRDLVLYEELTDERGEKYRHVLIGDTWARTPSSGGAEMGLRLSNLRAGTLYLETDNGDNPPIELEKFVLFYPVTRILFKAKENDSLLLYYGNRDVSAPRYDLSLVANELLAADKATASPGAEEVLKQSRVPRGVSGKGGVIFWGILALVVVVLLVVIARLLPKSDAQPPK